MADRRVAVITGASSGIGRAAALAFARRGDDVVLAARREGALAEVAARCEELAGNALAVPTDVRDEDAVHALAASTLERFGRIDVWVNNAGVSALGDFEAIPRRTWRQVVETDLFGCVYGTRAALRPMRSQGSGVIINNASIFGYLVGPHETPYVAAKWAILGFTESLRQELRGSGVEVCALLPAVIDTPILQHAANYSGRAVKPPNPVLPVERVAETIVSLALRPRREAIVGLGGRQQVLLRRALPGLAGRLTAWQVESDHFSKDVATVTDGNVLAPLATGTGSDGGWRRGGTRAATVAATIGQAASTAIRALPSPVRDRFSLTRALASVSR